eukprot:scaffold11009_cov127-Cylindrotheca_fusiformis.AAC.1
MQPEQIQSLQQIANGLASSSIGGGSSKAGGGPYVAAASTIAAAEGSPTGPAAELAAKEWQPA